MVPDSPTYLEGKVLLLCDGNSRVGSEETAVGARGHLWREESTRGGRGQLKLSVTHSHPLYFLLAPLRTRPLVLKQ